MAINTPPLTPLLELDSDTYNESRIDPIILRPWKWSSLLFCCTVAVPLALCSFSTLWCIGYTHWEAQTLSSLRWHSSPVNGVDPFDQLPWGGRSEMGPMALTVCGSRLEKGIGALHLNTTCALVFSTRSIWVSGIAVGFFPPISHLLSGLSPHRPLTKIFARFGVCKVCRMGAFWNQLIHFAVFPMWIVVLVLETISHYGSCSILWVSQRY